MDESLFELLKNHTESDDLFDCIGVTQELDSEKFINNLLMFLEVDELEEIAMMRVINQLVIDRLNSEIVSTIRVDDSGPEFNMYTSIVYDNQDKPIQVAFSDLSNAIFVPEIESFRLSA